MSAPSRLRRLFRWRLRSVLLLVALVGLGIGIWTSDVYCAWVYHLLGRDRDAWNAAIQAPRSPARDRVLVAALVNILDGEQASLDERRGALATLACLVPASAGALPALERALSKGDADSLYALDPVAELSRVNPDATRVLLAHRNSDLLNNATVGSSPLSTALECAGDESFPLLEAAFLAAVAQTPRSDQLLLPVVAALAQHGERAGALARPLATLAVDSRESPWLRVRAFSALAAMEERAAPALPALVSLLGDPDLDPPIELRDNLYAAIAAIGGPAPEGALAFLDRLEQRITSWDEADVSAYLALAPAEARRETTLRKILAHNGDSWKARRAALLAGRELLRIDPQAPEPLELARLVFEVGARDWEIDFALELLLAADPSALETLPQLLPGASPIQQAMILGLLRSKGAATAAARPALIEQLPVVTRQCRKDLLVLIGSLGAPDSRLVGMFQTELQAGPARDVVSLARDWVLRVGPDESAMNVLHELALQGFTSPGTSIFGRGPRPVFSRDICDASRDALRLLALEWLDSPSDDLCIGGAILLANIAPDHPALHAALARWLVPTPNPSVLSDFAVSMCAWLGPRARDLTPALFRRLVHFRPSSDVARAIRRVEGRVGAESIPGAKE